MIKIFASEVSATTRRSMNLKVLTENRDQNRRQVQQEDIDLHMYLSISNVDSGADSPRPLQGSAAGTITLTIPVPESFTTLPGSRTPLVSLAMSLAPQRSPISVHKGCVAGGN